MKKQNKLIVLLTALVFLSTGFLVGRVVYRVPTREIMIGYEHPTNKGQIDFLSIISDLEDQWAIDNIQQTLMYSQQVEGDSLNNGGADVQIRIKSPKRFAALTTADIWFTDEGAVIKMGEDDYRVINTMDADMLKQMIEYKE